MTVFETGAKRSFMGRHLIEPCPLCGKPAELEDNPHAPFCSERCKIIDLGQWASGKYRVPGEKVAPEKQAGEKEEEKNNHKDTKTPRKT